MRIIAVRHGQTTDNLKNLTVGHGPGRLNKLGLKQAKLLGKALKNEKMHFIYCSDLKRCKDTLKEISKFHKHVPVVFVESLRERNWGIFEGTHVQKRRDAFAKYKGSLLKFKPKGAESLLDMVKRFSDFYKYLKQNHSRDTVLLVTSAGILRVINSFLTKLSLEESIKKITFHNASISEYEITGSKVKVHRLGEIKHL